MDKLQEVRRERLVFRLTFISAAVAMIIVLALILVEAYVRWSMNLNFTFLGGSELEVLTVSAFATMLGLSYLYRPTKI